MARFGLGRFFESQERNFCFSGKKQKMKESEKVQKQFEEHRQYGNRRERNRQKERRCVCLKVSQERIK